MAFQCDKISSKRFSKWLQRVNVNNSFSECCKIHPAVPQGSIISPLVFNIFMNVICHMIQDAYIFNFTDNNSLYSVGDNLKEVKTIVMKNFKLVQVQFYKNCMILTPGKFHYLIRNRDTENESIKLGKKTLHAEAEQKLLGNIINKDLKFQNHTKSIIKKDNQKLGTLIRVVSFITDLNNKVFFKSILKASLIIVPYSECLALEL